MKTVGGTTDTPDVPREAPAGDDTSGWGEVETAAEVEQAAAAAPAETVPDPPPSAATWKLLAAPVDLICRAAPPPEVTAPEKEALAKSAADLIDWYFPGGPAQWGPVYAFVLTWGAVFGPRFAAQALEGGKAREPRSGDPQESDPPAAVSPDNPAPVDPFSDHPSPAGGGVVNVPR